MWRGNSGKLARGYGVIIPRDTRLRRKSKESCRNRLVRAGASLGRKLKAPERREVKTGDHVGAPRAGNRREGHWSMPRAPEHKTYMGKRENMEEKFVDCLRRSSIENIVKSCL